MFGTFANAKKLFSKIKPVLDLMHKLFKTGFNTIYQEYFSSIARAENKIKPVKSAAFHPTA